MPDLPYPQNPPYPFPVKQLHHDGDYSRKWIMECKHHPELRYRSKNPWDRSIFPEQGVDCPCPLEDLVVIGREAP